MVDEEVAIHIGEGGSGRVFRAGLFFFTGVSGFFCFFRAAEKKVLALVLALSPF